eukprot:5332015-Pleurochrysis_carterae.AAC.1
MPKPSDLSFYNWETQTSTSNATPNFQVHHACVRDRKERGRRKFGSEGKREGEGEVEGQSTMESC